MSQPDGSLRHVWERTQQLHVQCCQACGRRQHPPRATCGRCGAAELNWVAHPGAGTVVSHTTIHATAFAAWREATPYSVAVVELDGHTHDDAFVLASAAADADSLQVGQRGQVTVGPGRDDDVIAWFAPAPEHQVQR